MALVTIVTRDVTDRFRGFLASVMLEVAPCTYVSPRMSKGVRERVWSVMTQWHGVEPRGSIVMIWREREATGGVGLAHLGTPVKTLFELDGMWIARAGV
ncbi:type I-E CRISPR-associated endoribonuclease Cas2e [Limnohabitans sp. JirII-31]|uniref:type I-E CRISPR-associated endoribonuclease Cas2e n=1 Tax=Limnohabitans sp. JirII-31 TaxID=1977908 RepID=UPI000C1DF26B|nr:type I-E CRISPR-associated endoribonuclease Cas2 [Limnohabitans sp. JirII-31]